MTVRADVNREETFGNTKASAPKKGDFLYVEQGSRLEAARESGKSPEKAVLWGEVQERQRLRRDARLTKPCAGAFGEKIPEPGAAAGGIQRMPPGENQQSLLR